MAQDAQRFSELLGVLYETPLDASRWDQFLRLVTTALQGESAGIITHDIEKKTGSVVRLWNTDPEGGRLYSEYYGALDVWRVALANQLHRNWVDASDAIVSFDQLKRSEFYGDFLARYDIAHALFAIDGNYVRPTNLSVYRSRQRGEFSEKNVELARSLNPHLKCALRLHVELIESRNIRSGLEGALNSLSTGVILLDDRKRILLMNQAAEHILGQNDGLFATRKGLELEQASEQGEFDALVTRCFQTANAKGRDPGGGVMVSRRKRVPLQVFVSPIRGVANMLRCMTPAVIVLVNDPSRQVRPAQEILKALFRLTPAECRVALLLTDGRSTREIVDLLGITANTLKSQLSAIYGKTGVSRQAQLVKLFSLLPRSAPF